MSGRSLLAVTFVLRYSCVFILPDRSDFNYNLRPRRHNLVLTAKSSSITDRDYITRMIFKKHLLMLTHAFALFSLPVYMFRFRLLLFFIIVHLI